MAKFDPEHATVPTTNFADRNSAEQFLDCGKFRQRCANLTLDRLGLPQPNFVYIPICLESRFERAGIAQYVPMPVRELPMSPTIYATLPVWAPLLSCPRNCRGYRNKYWAAMVLSLQKLLRGSQGRRTGATQGNASSDGPFTQALSNGWVQGLGVTFIAALIYLLVAIWTHTGIKAAEITVIAFLIATILAFLMAVVRYWDFRW